MQRHDYSPRDDFLAMQALTQRTWSPRSRWHVGDVAWQRSSGAGGESDWRTALWSHAGQYVAWGWVELPDELGLVVDPDLPELVSEVLDWFDQVAIGATRSCTILESEAHLVDGLQAAGFRPVLDQPYFRQHAIRLDDLRAPRLPDGFRVRHVETHEAAARAAVHRAGWSDVHSQLSTETMARVMSTWPYRADLDWVVETADGHLVASALGWLDDVNHVGLLEPVGCAPSYRRRGLASAVNLACLHAMRAAGARTAHVFPRGDAAYPVPAVLYQGIGFEPGPRTVSYQRPAAVVG